MPSLSAQLLIDGVPYDVQIKPFTFNTETRFTISFNGSGEYIFAWDSGLGMFAAIGTESTAIPDNLEEAISQKLLTLIRQSQP